MLINEQDPLDGPAGPCVAPEPGDARNARPGSCRTGRLAEAIVESATDMVLALDHDYRLVFLNAACAAELGRMYGRAVAVGDDLLAALDQHPEDRRKLADIWSRGLGGEEAMATVELGPPARRRFHELRCCPLRDASGAVAGAAGVVRDVTGRKEDERQMAHLAFHDCLTGLPNRARYLDRLAHAVSIAKRDRGYLFAVLFLDLDRFKRINDSLGHPVGDGLLVEVGKRLRECVREHDTVARFGGDEFAVLLENLTCHDQAVAAAGRIGQVLAAPFQVAGNELFTSASVGIVLGPAAEADAATLLRDADTAMYHAKKQGKNRVAVFDPALHDLAAKCLDSEYELRHAIEANQFEVHYQPMVSLNTGRVVSLEALARWRHPGRGLLLPEEFIPQAEDGGLIVALGRNIFASICDHLRLWRGMLLDGSQLVVSVNLSPSQFLDPDLFREVAGVLGCGLPPRLLNLEISEATLTGARGEGGLVMAALRALGIELSIDDFGAGNASLSRLSSYPASLLKIDRSLIGQLDGEPSSREIILAIVMLARNLGKQVVAEGVETPGQLAELTRLGCDFAQGNLLCPPLDARDATALLEAIGASDFLLPSWNLRATA